MKRETLSPCAYIALILLTLITFFLCVSLGSVRVTLSEMTEVLKGGGNENYKRIILYVRLPRVICAGFLGAALSAGGAAMQGLLKNPLADGSTLGVSAGASLGAVISIWLGLYTAFGVMPFAIASAFASLVIILRLSSRLDNNLSNNTVILMGVIFSMFANSAISLIIALSGEKIRPIMFWTMGSVTDANYRYVLTLFITCTVCGALLLSRARELNAFALGEDNAMHIGVNVKKTRLVILITVSLLIGVSVSIGGTIAFVGLVVPHMTRLVTGPNHHRLLPASVFFGAIFLMAADLISRTLLSPRELPIGVITSLIGSVLFLFIFAKIRGKNRHA